MTDDKKKAPRFLSWRDFPEGGAPVVGMLRAPFHAYAGGRRGAPIELVFGFQSEFFDRATRPFSLRICGEGWIRLEKQLGADVTAWPNREVALKRANTGGHDYIAVHVPAAPEAK